LDIRPTPEQIEALRQIDMSTLANAIEVFGVRLRNEGFEDSTIHCLFGSTPPMVGYAVAARIRRSNPSPTGHTYFERTDWWNHTLNTPAPRVFVMQDVDERPRFGAFLGEVHTNILKALGCAGAAPNGAVRDLPAVEALGVPLFAGGVDVSHAYAHFIDFCGEVEVGGLIEKYKSNSPNPQTSEAGDEIKN